MDVYHLSTKIVVIMLMTSYCWTEQIVAPPIVVKIPRHIKMSPRERQILYKAMYDSIIETCMDGGYYLCKYDLYSDVRYVQYPTCISIQQRCDGVPDCPLYDDEIGCPPKCNNYEMQCSDGRCAKICDNNPECINLQDELFCAPVCQDGHVRCPDGKCARVCDGKVECTSGLDEINCDYTSYRSTYLNCEPGEVICSDLSGCATVCDGITQCYDGGDERYCMPQCEDKSQIICQSGRCGTVCDGIQDCTIVTLYGTSSDEINCNNDDNMGT